MGVEGMPFRNKQIKKRKFASNETGFGFIGHGHHRFCGSYFRDRSGGGLPIYEQKILRNGDSSMDIVSEPWRWRSSFDFIRDFVVVWR